MRIIAGKYNRRIIKTIPGLNTRPVTDRIKESIFNMIVHRYSLDEKLVLDLFAGSGSFGLEALSRGAKEVTFVEKANESSAIIKENIQALGCGKECKVQNTEVESYLKRCSAKFDFIFCDPPFKLENILDIPKLILETNVLSDDGILVFRSCFKIDFAAYGYSVLHDKVIGRSYIYFLRKK